MNKHLRLVPDDGRPPAINEVPVQAIGNLTTFRAYLTPTQRVLLTDWMKKHEVDYSISVEGC